MSGYLRRRWNGFDSDIARPVSPLSDAISSRRYTLKEPMSLELADSSDTRLAVVSP